MKTAPNRVTELLDDPVQTINELAAYTKKHPKTLYRLIREGKGPKTVRITSHSIGVRRSAVEAWLQSLER
jgi:predicted DNA-binding transcriptional regulator AlpA